MKISVNLTVTVDPQRWDAVYGAGDRPEEVRNDVRRYVLYSVQGLAGIEESRATVEIRR